MIGRTLIARAVLNMVDRAMAAAGGGAFYRTTGLEWGWDAAHTGQIALKEVSDGCE